MMRKLMILGAIYAQIPLIKAAKALGYHTTVASIPGNYEGFGVADEICYADISQPEEVLLAAKRHNINGIATCAIDTGVAALGLVCDKMRLCGLSESAAGLSSNKYLMKAAFEQGKVNTANYHKVTTLSELDSALEDLCLPVIVKAVDLQSSRGIYIARTKAQAHDGFYRAIQESAADFCIVEEFLEGLEFGAQAFVFEGRIVFVMPHGDEVYQSFTAVPIGHFVPFTATDHMIQKAVGQVELAIQAIGLDNCAVNVDLIYSRGEVYVIEIAGRAGATCLPEIVSFYYGIDYYKMIACMAMGEDPREIFNRRQAVPTPNIARLVISKKTGVVKRIRNNYGMDNDVVDISFNIQVGSKVNRFTTSRDRIGQVIVKGRSLEACRNKIDRVFENIEIEIE